MKPDHDLRAEAGGSLGGRRRRGFLPRWAGFWLSGPLLLLALASEGIYSLLRLALFPLHARATRERIALLVRGGAAGAVCVAVPLLVGCTSFPGTSFGKQVEELSWSTREMILGEPPARSFRMLAEDTQSLLTGTSFREIAWDIDQIFWDPKWYGSLSDDVSDFVSWKARHFTETFDMLGW